MTLACCTKFHKYVYATPFTDATVSKETALITRSKCHDSDCYVIVSSNLLPDSCGARFSGTARCQARGAVDPLLSCTCGDALAKR